jgi:hypothetical protein
MPAYLGDTRPGVESAEAARVLQHPGGPFFEPVSRRERHTIRRLPGMSPTYPEAARSPAGFCRTAGDHPSFTKRPAIGLEATAGALRQACSYLGLHPAPKSCVRGVSEVEQYSLPNTLGTPPIDFTVFQ